MAGPVGRSDELLVRLLRTSSRRYGRETQAQLSVPPDTSRTPPETEDPDIALQRLTEQLSESLAPHQKPRSAEYEAGAASRLAGWF